VTGGGLFDHLGDLVEAFDTKADALGGGTLEKLVGAGSLRIHRGDGPIEEERTYPLSDDPRRSEG
jgi:hypothetical protein